VARSATTRCGLVQDRQHLTDVGPDAKGAVAATGDDGYPDVLVVSEIDQGIAHFLKRLRIDGVQRARTIYII